MHSCTATIEQRNSESGAIFLSPSKRRKVDSEDEQGFNEPTTHELWKWTFKHESIASCFIRDVFSMEDNTEKGKVTDVLYDGTLIFPEEVNFFRLGRVPCRTVRIVGLVVGVKIYEKTIRYTVDDGTAVVDCQHRQLRPPKTPVKKLQTSPQATKSQTKSTPLAPKPVAPVGIPVCVVGRVVRKHQTREIVVDSIVRCPSANDEPRHWLEVHRLHKSHYSASTPFRIPQATAAPSQPSSPVKAITDRRSVVVESVTAAIAEPPSTAPSTPSTTNSTPSTSPIAASPTKSTTAQSPQKLRHPSRLHSRDLNGNTFRIYVKHYMDRVTHTDHTPELHYDSDTNLASEYPSTPTKSSRRVTSDETPRPSCFNLSTRTPRPRIPALSFDTRPPSRSFGATDGRSTDIPSTTGFTLSYLRRVPELADMAKRVVKAVAKRRLREVRKTAKEAAATASSSTSRTKSSASTSQAEEAEKLGPRIKRLFQSTVVQLLREGSIVLWDGPTHPCPQFPRESDSGLWKSNVTSTSADSTVFSTTSGVSVSQVGDEDLELSEPESNEEAYVPLSPQFLAGVVESAIGKLTNVPSVTARYGASTTEGILAYLRKDDRWRYLSEWNIGEALEVLKKEGRAWCVGRERWELSL